MHNLTEQVYEIVFFETRTQEQQGPPPKDLRERATEYSIIMNGALVLVMAHHNLSLEQLPPVGGSSSK